MLGVRGIDVDRTACRYFEDVLDSGCGYTKGKCYSGIRSRINTGTAGGGKAQPADTERQSELNLYFGVRDNNIQHAATLGKPEKFYGTGNMDPQSRLDGIAVEGLGFCRGVDFKPGIRIKSQSDILAEIRFQCYCHAHDKSLAINAHSPVNMDESDGVKLGCGLGFDLQPIVCQQKFKTALHGQRIRHDKTPVHFNEEPASGDFHVSGYQVPVFIPNKPALFIN